MFILGFSVVFILLGISTTTIGSVFYDYSIWIARIGGALLITFGIHLTGLFTIPILERQLSFKMKNKPTSQVGSFVIGMSFGAGWTPCIGPILAGILTIAATSTSIWTGIQLLSFYALGLAIPFFVSALVIERFISFFQRIRRWMPWINRISGTILIVIGIILLTGQLALITSYVPNTKTQFSI
jgi:cytochrome c-type biogenesis protein